MSMMLAFSAAGTVNGHEDAPVYPPNCFCCSHALMPDSAIIPLGPGPVATLDVPLTERWSRGVRPVLDHSPHGRA